MSIQAVPVSKAVPATRPEPTLAGCTIIVDDRTIHLPPTAYMLSGFRAWATSDDSPEFGRFSFIDNEIIIDLSMDEIETHNKVKTACTTAVVNLNRKLDLGEVYGDGARVSNDAAGLSAQPDAVFATWESFESDRVRLVPRRNTVDQYVEIEGSPDWVMEIVSESSVRKDTVWLRDAYHRAGVREYWLIDARGEEIDFQVLAFQANGYVPAPERKGWQQSVVFNRWVRLQRKRGRLNLWQDTLQMKALR